MNSRFLKPIRHWSRPLGLAALACALAGTGCRAFQKKDGGTGNSHDEGATKGDPLFGRMIPKQDIPIPGKSDVATRDPLLKNGSANAGERREPFRLGPENTTASLAGKPRDDVPALDDRAAGTNMNRGPVPFQPVGGTRPADPLNIPSAEAQLDELRRLGAQFNAPSRDAAGEYLFSCDVPLSADGPTRRYEGAGLSPAAAVKQVLDQVRADRAK